MLLRKYWGDSRLVRAHHIFLLLALSGICACGGGGGASNSGSLPVPPAVPPPSTTTVNVNITDPVLTVALNTAILPGGAVNLVWSEEFDGAQLDPEIWFFESEDGSQYGIPGWGNNELEWYMPDNAELRDGMLIITAREEAQSGKNHTSARINTRDRFAFRYGRIEARMRLPGGQGLWPAFWLLPQDNVYGSWAASGEIDVMEAVNIGASGGNTVYGTIHYGGMAPANVFSGDEYLVASDAATDFHDYALEWDTTEMRWYVDDVLFGTQNSWSTVSARRCCRNCRWNSRWRLKIWWRSRWRGVLADE